MSDRRDRSEGSPSTLKAVGTGGRAGRYPRVSRRRGAGWELVLCRRSLSRAGSRLRARKTIRLKLAGKEVERTALFDTGSSYTVVQRAFFERSFGASWERLSKPVKLYLINGEYVEADKYAQVTMVVDDVELLPLETVLVLDEYAGEVEGARVKLPEVIVGAGTMDKYGILLDPREDVKVVSAGFLLSSS
jgi:hypothetical protein